MLNLAPKKHWDKSYKNYKLIKNRANGSLEKWLLKVISDNNLESKTVFEVGCFPGSYLQLFGEFNCVLNGIDNTKRTTELAVFLRKCKYKVGHIFNRNLFTNKVLKKYDIVCSFGFIEHFYDWRRVIELHSNYVNSSGYLIITVPNFYGYVQRIFHTIIDGENLLRHNIDAMKLKKISSFLQTLGYDIINMQAIGEFSTWHENHNPSFIQRKIIKLYQEKLKFLEKREPSIHWSPYLGIVAKRNSK